MFLPENIDLAYSERYNLSIRLSPNGFSFCIFSLEDSSIFHFQETTMGANLTYIENLKKVIFDLGFFSQSFKKVTVTVASIFYTLVPEEYFDKKHIDELFRFNFHNAQGIVLADPTINQSYHTLFNIEEEVHSFLSRNLWNPKFFHHSASLTKLFHSYMGSDDGNNCFVDFHDQYVTIICFGDRQLLSSNSYQVNDPHDATYFIASIWEKLQFNQMTDKLYLSGKIDDHKTTVDLLRKLIRHVEQVHLQPKTKIEETQLNNLPTDLLASLCV